VGYCWVVQDSLRLGRIKQARVKHCSLFLLYFRGEKKVLIKLTPEANMIKYFTAIILNVTNKLVPYSQHSIFFVTYALVQ
jgi:hypothetical protein